MPFKEHIENVLVYGAAKGAAHGVEKGIIKCLAKRKTLC